MRSMNVHSEMWKLLRFQSVHYRGFQSIHSQDNSQYRRPLVSFLYVKSDRLMNLRRFSRETPSTPIGDRFTVNLLVQASSSWKY